MKVACVLTSLCLTVVVSMVVPGHGTPDPAQKQRDRREFDEVAPCVVCAKEKPH